MVWNRSRESTWSALAFSGACRLSRVTSARQPSMSPLAIQSTVLRSNSGSGLDHVSDRLAQLDEPLRPRQRRREDVRVDRHDRQVGLRPQRDDRTGDAVVDAELVAERQVEAGIEAQLGQSAWVAYILNR